MKTSAHPLAKPSRRTGKRPAAKAAKKPAKRTHAPRGEDAVALAVGRALMRKPRVNTALLAIMRQNRDLLPL